MHILHLCAIFPPQIGGPSKQAYDLVKTQALTSDLTPIVLTFGQQWGKTNTEGFDIYHVGSWLHVPGVLGTLIRQSLMFIMLLYIYFRFRYSWMHVHDIRVLGLVSGIVAKIIRVKSIIKYPGDPVFETINESKLRADIPQVFHYNPQARWVFALQKLAFALHGSVWAPSRYQALILQQHYKLPITKIKTIPNYIHIKRDRIKPKRINHLTRVLLASRDVPWKQLDRLPSIAKNVKDMKIEWVIVSPKSPQLSRMLKKLPSRHLVDFIGPRSPLSMSSVYRSSDIFLSLTLYEPFGIVFVEAAAAGLPVVAPDIGGIPEIVQHKHTGYLYQPNNWEEAAGYLRLLISNAPLYAQIRLSAQKQSYRYHLTPSKALSFYA